MPNWSFFAFHLKLSFSELIPCNFICPWVFSFEVLNPHCVFLWTLCNFLGSSTIGSGLGCSHPAGTWPREAHPNTMVQAGGPFLPDAWGSLAKTCPSHDRLTSWAPHSEVAKWIWGPGVQAPCRFSTSRPGHVLAWRYHSQARGSKLHTPFRTSRLAGKPASYMFYMSVAQVPHYHNFAQMIFIIYDKYENMTYIPR